jgi:hypothetical protein
MFLTITFPCGYSYDSYYKKNQLGLREMKHTVQGPIPDHYMDKDLTLVIIVCGLHLGK